MNIIQLKESIQIKICQSNFDIIFKTYFRRLVHYANSFLNDSNLSEDMVQEVFLRFWEKRKDLQIQNSLKEYLFRSVRNKCINYMRDQKSVEVYANDLIQKIDEEQVVYMNTSCDENINLLYQAIENLTPKRKQILHYGLFGLKNHEIAELMGVSINTLKTQKSYAYKTLRTVLEF